MKGEINWRKRDAGVKKNRDAIRGKMALLATYEQLGQGDCEAAGQLVCQIRRLRTYMKNRTGDDE